MKYFKKLYVFLIALKNLLKFINKILFFDISTETTDKSKNQTTLTPLKSTS